MVQMALDCVSSRLNFKKKFPCDLNLWWCESPTR